MGEGAGAGEGWVGENGMEVVGVGVGDRRKQSLTDDEATPQKKKVKIPSYLSRETSKGKAHIHKIQARLRCNARNKNKNKQTTTKKQLGITQVEKR